MLFGFTSFTLSLSLSLRRHAADSRRLKCEADISLLLLNVFPWYMTKWQKSGSKSPTWLYKTHAGWRRDAAPAHMWLCVSALLCVAPQLADPEGSASCRERRRTARHDVKIGSCLPLAHEHSICERKRYIHVYACRTAGCWFRKLWAHFGGGVQIQMFWRDAAAKVLRSCSANQGSDYRLGL